MNRADLTVAAQLEQALREKQADWPACDLTAWRAIASLLERGSIETELTWEQMLAALAEAEARRIDAVIAAKGTAKEPQLEQRLGAVVAIRRSLQRSAWRHGHCLPEGIAA